MSSQSSSPRVERRLSEFLSLAPATSDSYPQAQKSLKQQPKVASAAPASAPQPLTEGALDATKTAAAPSETQAKRRTSSMSSDGTRFLRLGPVHWGEHMGDHQGDFAVE
jgi:hypothetical protein